MQKKLRRKQQEKRIKATKPKDSNEKPQNKNKPSSANNNEQPVASKPKRVFNIIKVSNGKSISTENAIN